MPDSLDIAEVARLTGLTSRALRFYEARGLVTPLRTASGRRHYGAPELERLHQIIAMKRAGLTLAQIQRLSAGRRLDLRGIVEAQIESLAERAGLRGYRIEIAPDGTISIVVGSPEAPEAPEPA